MNEQPRSFAEGTKKEKAGDCDAGEEESM